MIFASSRNVERTATLTTAIGRGLAPDGGLYIPQSLPRLQGGPDSTLLPAVAHWALEPFFSGDQLHPELAQIASEAFNFPAPLVALESGREPVEVLELFHGPTAAFKDFGARFLSGCLERVRAGSQRPLTILVATSGDTGGAVAAAFHRRPWVEVFVLFPLGQVSPRQQQQLTCWGDNVHSYAVRGSFDDCQRLVKGAFSDADITAARELSSANSINIGRLLPQLVYYAAASLQVQERTGRKASFIVPSGNLGNVMACVWAREAGLPIGRIVLAHNANRTVPDYLQTGQWQPRSSVATLASAMDVGDPSNMERLRALYPQVHALRDQVQAVSVDDDAICARIRADYATWGRVWCPHTATAAEAYARLPQQEREAHHWVIVATAHPAKFSEIVEPLIGREIPVPEALAALLTLPAHCRQLDADAGLFKQELIAA